jgi:hypothetical protein
MPGSTPYRRIDPVISLIEIFVRPIRARECTQHYPCATYMNSRTCNFFLSFFSLYKILKHLQSCLQRIRIKIPTLVTDRSKVVGLVRKSGFNVTKYAQHAASALHVAYLARDTRSACGGVLVSRPEGSTQAPRSPSRNLYPLGQHGGGTCEARVNTFLEAMDKVSPYLFPSHY